MNQGWYIKIKINMRFLLSYIIYIATVNRTPFAIFDNYRDMNRWVQNYKVTHPSIDTMSRAEVSIYQCMDYDVVGQTCRIYKSFEQ